MNSFLLALGKYVPLAIAAVEAGVKDESQVLAVLNSANASVTDKIDAGVQLLKDETAAIIGAMAAGAKAPPAHKQ